MARASPNGFRRGETVMNLDDLPGVPSGTRGRVLLSNGFTWVRYRVLFDNGIDIGSIDSGHLARPKEFAAAQARRRAAEEAAESTTVDDAGSDEVVAAGEGGEAKVVNGVTVPAHLLERARRARERLAG